MIRDAIFDHGFVEAESVDEARSLADCIATTQDKPAKKLSRLLMLSLPTTDAFSSKRKVSKKLSQSMLAQHVLIRYWKENQGLQGGRRV